MRRRVGVRWMDCPACGLPWPVPEGPAYAGTDVDARCPVCLHAEIAQLQRAAAMLESARTSS